MRVWRRCRADGCLLPSDALNLSISATGTQCDCKQIRPYRSLYLCVRGFLKARGGQEWDLQLGCDPGWKIQYLLGAPGLQCLCWSSWWKSDPRLLASKPPTRFSRLPSAKGKHTPKDGTYLKTRWFMVCLCQAKWKLPWVPSARPRFIHLLPSFVWLCPERPLLCRFAWRAWTACEVEVDASKSSQQGMRGYVQLFFFFFQIGNKTKKDFHCNQSRAGESVLNQVYLTL